MASSPTFLLYGANGYTGELIAEEAVRRGLRPILAGRREEAVRPIAERLGLERRIFALTSPDEIARQLDGVAAVLLAAGPFSATSAPVVEACLRARKHYLDITGEIEVFEAIFRRGPQTRPPRRRAPGAGLRGRKPLQQGNGEDDARGPAQGERGARGRPPPPRAARLANGANPLPRPRAHGDDHRLGGCFHGLSFDRNPGHRRLPGPARACDRQGAPDALPCADPRS